MRYMLDTNICIYLIKKKPLQVLEKLHKGVSEDTKTNRILPTNVIKKP